MPCDSIITQRVAFRVENRAMLVDALRAAFGRVSERGDVLTVEHPQYGPVTLDLRTNEVRTRGYSRVPIGAIADELRRTYTKHVLGVAAKKYRWRIQEADATHLTVTR